MRNWKRLLVLVVLTAAVGAASFAVEDEVNAQTAGSAGAPPSTAKGGTTSTGGTSSTPPATTSTTSTSDSEKKDSGGGCSVAAPASGSGIGALIGLALGLTLWRRRKED
jgi:MYXO-CTERM domain-containing protein